MHTSFLSKRKLVITEKLLRARNCVKKCKYKCLYINESLLTFTITFDMFLVVFHPATETGTKDFANLEIIDFKEVKTTCQRDELGHYTKMYFTDNF